jgi:hypothetical protein
MAQSTLLVHCSFCHLTFVSWNVDALKTSGTFPTVYLASFNHLAVVCWSHNLTASAVSFFSHDLPKNKESQPIP